MPEYDRARDSREMGYIRCGGSAFAFVYVDSALGESVLIMKAPTPPSTSVTSPAKAHCIPASATHLISRSPELNAHVVCVRHQQVT